MKLMLGRPNRSKSSSPEKSENKINSTNGGSTEKKNTTTTDHSTTTITKATLERTKNLAKILLESTSASGTGSPRRVLDLDMVTEESDSNADDGEGAATVAVAPVEEEEEEEAPERVLFPVDSQPQQQQQQPPQQQQQQSGEQESAPLPVIHPSLDVYGNLISSHKKRSRKSTIAPLPTLSEASLEDGSEADARNGSFDSWEDNDGDDVPFPPAESSVMFSSFNSSTSTSSTNNNLNSNNNNNKAAITAGNGKTTVRKASQPPGTVKRTAAEKMRDLQTRAADRAGRGLEEDAVRLYRRALQAGRRDVTRVKGQLQQVTTTKKHQHTAVAARSIASRLHEDWMEIGVLIADTRNAQAAIYERLGVYDRAMSCCAEALAVYRRQAKFLKKQKPGSEESVLSQIRSMTETTRRIEGARDSYEERKRAHEEIIAMRLELSQPPPQERQPQKHLSQHAALQDKVRRVRTSEMEILGPEHPQLGDTASLLGSLALERGDREAAIPHMMEAYAIMKNSLGMKHPRTGMKLLHIASVYNNPALQARRRPKMEEQLAIDFYTQAIQVFRASENCPFFLGSTLNDLAVLYIGRREFPRAVDMLEESLQAYQEGQETDAATASWDTAQVWLNLGECHSQQRDFEQASTAFMNALNVQRDGRKVFEQAFKHDSGTATSGENVPPAHLVDDRRIADTLRRLGRAYVGFAAYDRAMVFYKEACLIHKNEVKKAVQIHKGKDTNLLPGMQDELAQTIYCMAELNELTGKTETAARLFSESLQLRLFSDAHKPTRTNMVHCAMCLNGLGNIHLKKNEFDQAQGVLKEALGYCSAHGVPDDHPIVQMITQRLQQAVDAFEDWNVDEATKLEQRALTLLEQGKHDAAVLTLTSVMQLRKDALKKLRDQGQNSTEAKFTTACTLKLFGQVLAAKGDDASAERAYKDSLKLFKKAGTANTELVVIQVCQELNRLQGADIGGRPSGNDPVMK